MAGIEASGLFARRWARFDAYEVRKDCICPCRGASLEYYDPWLLYEESRRAGSGIEGPHTRLLSILGGGWSTGSRPGRPQEARRTLPALLDWAREYGLPGLLLETVRQVTLAPRWYGIPVGTLDQVFPSQVTYAASGGLWKSRRRDFDWCVMYETDGDPEVAARAGEAISPKILQQLARRANSLGLWQPPGVLLHDGVMWTSSPLSGYWSRFFPDVRQSEAESYDYPVPLSEEFWRVYGEPLDEVLSWLRHVLEVMERLSGELVLLPLGDRVNYQDRLLDYERLGLNTLARRLVSMRAEQRTWGAAEISQLLAGCSPVLQIDDDGGVGQRWQTSSLAGSLVLMASRELAEEGRWLRTCRTCGRFFSTANYQQLSCSRKCTWNYHKRQQRADERFLTREGPLEARRLSRLGHSVGDIHVALQARVGFTLSRRLIAEWTREDL